jgi:hypothetical protein
VSQKDARRPLDEFALEQALREHCVNRGLDPGYVLFAMQHRHKPDDDWRWCCGSNCDPCVQRLGRVVDGARQALCLRPPPGPGDARPS